MTKTEIKKLQAVLESGDIRASLGSFLAPKLRRAPVKPMMQQRLAKKRLTRVEENAETALIRAECMVRANGFCECGCGSVLMMDSLMWQPEMDEWENGNGRRRQNRSVKTCWILVAFHHRHRQQYFGGLAYWNAKRLAHDKKYGYPHHPHIEHATLRRSTR